MPELETWTIDNSAIVQQKSDRVLQLGINLGAPGDRRDAKGVTWLEFPVVAGDSPSFGIEVDGPYTTFQDHPATMTGAQTPWISASGVQGLSALRVWLKPVSPYKLGTGIPIVDASDDADEVKITPDLNVALSPYRVKLLFGMPKSVGVSTRQFSVSVQGTQITTEVELDPFKEKELVKTMERVMLGDVLELNFKPIVGVPILSGVEITKLDE